MNRYWISYSSGEPGGDNALGIALVEARDHDHAAELAKQYAPPLGPQSETMILLMPGEGNDMGADIEWRRFEKNRFIGPDELQKFRYKSSYSLDKEKLQELELAKRTDPRIKIVKQ